MLVDKKAKVAISQMSAIVLYLGETLDLLPATPALRALTMKIVNDANDVIDEITLDGGREMWTEKRWHDFVPRLKKWMSIWEETGRRHGLHAKSGFMLGGEAPGVADVVTAVLWSTMTERFPKIEAILEETAPMTAALVQRVAALPALATARRQSARGLWRRLLRRPDRGFPAQGVEGVDGGVRRSARYLRCVFPLDFPRTYDS